MKSFKILTKNRLGTRVSVGTFESKKRALQIVRGQRVLDKKNNRKTKYIIKSFGVGKFL